jgi:SAM-dependent methyltransferase
VTARPLYGELAWAYDLVVPAPAGPPPERVAALLRERGVQRGAALVDAGCGTGRYAAALAALGFAVTGVDASAPLIAQAPAAAGVEWVVADLLAWAPPRPVDAVLCRGVLNDLVADADRAGAFGAFARWLRPGGALVADVRDWEQTARRYGAAPVRTERVVEADGRRLRFTAETALDPQRRAMRVRERYAAVAGGAAVERAGVFDMRCFTADELRALAARAGFARADVRAGAQAGAAPDRLVAVCVR